MQPGALVVTVTSSVDGTPINGATVAISSPSDSRSFDTGVLGQSTFNGLPPDNYRVIATKPGFTQAGDVSASVPPGSGAVGGTPATATVSLTPITVTLTLPQPVACPGHPFEMDAAGTPAGGTFAWTVSGGGASLTDSGGVTAATSGPQVFLVSYQPDNTNANIPAQSASVTVTYTLPDGNASATQTVNVHKIDFVVTSATVTTGRTASIETTGGVQLWNDQATGAPEVLSDPKVQIKLDASCPRKSDCAGNYRVGWLQVVLTNDRRSRFNDSEVDINTPVPIRDVWPPDGLPPFYHSPDVHTFTGDGDTETVHHEDSPLQSAPWIDPRPGAPAASRLFQMFFSNGFAAWLGVQNIEWSLHDMPGSFVFLRNFKWSMHLDVTIDMTKSVGSRCTPKSSAVSLDQAPQTGRGGSSPLFSAPFAASAATVNVAAAAHVP